MSKMLHYTFAGEQVEEDDPRADYQVNPNDPEKDKLIESYKKLSPLTAAAPAAASTVENPNYGSDKVSGVGEPAAPAATSKPNEAPKKATASEK